MLIELFTKFISFTVLLRNGLNARLQQLSLSLLLIIFISPQSSAKHFVIGVEDVPYYPLFDFNTDKLTYTKELIQLFAAESGHTFSFLPLPVKRFDKWLIENEIDFKYPDNLRWNQSNNLQDKLTFSDSTVSLVSATIVLSNRAQEPPENFKNLGTILGFYPSLWVDAIEQKKVSLHENSSPKLLIRQVINGQLDGINLDPSVIQHQLRELGYKGDELTFQSNMEFEVYDFYLSTLHHPNIIKEFNRFMANNAPLIKQLQHKYTIFDATTYK